MVAPVSHLVGFWFINPTAVAGNGTSALVVISP